MADVPLRFGPYEIVCPIGAGGMGEVYRARDTRLHRFVAIKILHKATALDPDRQRRFAEEAVAASALNHPNIVTIYDVGADGHTQYLVSELIEGESLRAEMNHGRVALKRVIEIAHQMAEGLAAAHDAGIVHRDLKPDNVMVTPDGRVKIVDFGLATAPEPDAALSKGPTATQTAAGLIFGTVPYMSPEQARGEHADFRSDQFAFGVMLYELTTAAHPFKRETAVQTLSAIIGDEPPDPAQANPTLPVALRWLIRRLLAKNPRQRFADTADLAADLRTIREHLSEAMLNVAPTVAPGPRRWHRIAVLGALLVSGFLLAPAVVPGSARVQFEKFTPFATDEGYQGSPVWSPDGKTIAYEAEVNGVVQIFTRTLGSSMRTKVTNSRFDCFISTWSADGNIYFHSRARDQDALWRVLPLGGNAELMIEGASQSAVAPDGKTVFFLREDRKGGLTLTLWSASLPDGEPHRYARGSLKGKVASSGFLRFSPDGSRLMLWLGPSTQTLAGFWEIAMPDGEPRELLPALSSPGLVPASFSWTPDNRHIVVTRSDGPTTGTHLWLADTHTGRLDPLTTTPGNEGSPSVSPAGRTIAFTSEATDFDLFEVPLDGSPLKPFLSSTRNEFDPAALPTNTQFAFVTDRSGSLQIWLQNQEGYLQRPLVTEADFGGAASMAVGSLAFSPDGTKLAFQRAAAASDSTQTAGSRLWIISVAGGKPVALGGNDAFQDAPTWSPSGDWIAYLETRQGDVALVKIQLGGRAEPVTLVKSGIPPFIVRPQWSPAGDSILCETVEGLTIVSADGSSQRVISDPGWFAYAWDTDGRRIYGLRPTDDGHHIMLVSVDAQTGAERVVNASLGTIPQALQPIRGFSRMQGRGFLTSTARVKSDIYLIEAFRLPLTLWDRLWWPGRARLH
jgi:serine/threonine protein kinase/Tol biopolymer transport system component